MILPPEYYLNPETDIDRTLTLGPSSVAKALGITLIDNGESLGGPRIWIEDRGVKLNENDISCTPRIGVDYAAEDALLTWRFTVNSITQKGYK